MMRRLCACVVLPLLVGCSSEEPGNEGPHNLLSGAMGGPGAWPTDPVKNYSSAYGFGAVQSVGFDDGQNLWLLDGDRIGVLRAADKKLVWVSRLGQAAPGFGDEQRATGSTVICGGSPGRAYVGYRTYDLSDVLLGDVNDPEYQRGDLDVVKLDDQGDIILETHLGESVVYQGAAQNKLGIRNTNDWRYDEDRSVLVCRRLRKGPRAGDLFVGTNHGVTLVRGTTYNSHRHPVWDVNGSLRVGYSFALGSSFDGAQVLIGNEWKIGVLAAPADLAHWDRATENPWILDTHVDALNDLEDMDYWRGFAQTKDGAYYLSSDRYGLWKMSGTTKPQYAKVSGLPDGLTQLEAANDGSLFIGTKGSGLWRLGADGKASKVSSVPGSEVKQLVYEPQLTPPMLFVVTEAGVTVVRSN